MLLLTATNAAGVVVTELIVSATTTVACNAFFVPKASFTGVVGMDLMPSSDASL